MESKALVTTSKPHSQPCEQGQRRKLDLISDWIGKLALNAGKGLTPDELGVFERLWMEGLEDLSYGVLEQALRRTLQTCKYWPVKVSDIREQVDRATEVYATADAELKWSRVLDYIRVHWNPDLPGRASRGAPNITSRTMHAIKCAGGLAEIADCPREHLHFKKELFIEAYTRWDALQRDQYLLPADSPVRRLIGEFVDPSPENFARITEITRRALPDLPETRE